MELVHCASPLAANESIGRPIDKRHKHFQLYLGLCVYSTAQLSPLNTGGELEAMQASPTTTATLVEKILPIICPLANNPNYGEVNL